MSVKFVTETVLTAKDQTGSAFAALTRKAENAKKSVGGLQKMAASGVQMRNMGNGQFAEQHISGLGRIKTMAVAASAGLATLGAGAVATNAVNISAKYEDLAASMTAVSSVADAAGRSLDVKSNLDYITKFAKETPYGMAEVADSFMQLKGAGLDPLSAGFKSLGDAASGRGKTFNDASQMITDAVMGENERLKEFLVKASTKGSNITYRYKDKAGKDQVRTADKNNQGQIADTIYKIMDEKFGGAMVERSKTFNGLLSNMKDTVSGLQRQFMSAGLFDGMKASLQNKLDLLTKLSESGAAERWGAAAASAAGRVSDAFSKVGSGISSISQRISGFVGGWGNLGRVLGLVSDKAQSIAGTSGLPKWMTEIRSMGDTSMMSPLLDQLREIKSGDTLWGISKQTLGVGEKYAEIAALNKDIIKDANKIFPGQKIKVPKLSGLPDWAKARSLSSDQQSPVTPSAKPAAANNVIAIAELAKTNKVLAAAVLVRAAWDKTLTHLSAAFERFKTSFGAGINQVADWAISHSDTIVTAFSLLSGGVVGAFTRFPTIAAKSLTFLGGVWKSAFSKMQTSLPALQSQVKNVTSTIGAWFTANAGKIKEAFGGIAAAAMDRFGKSMAWLNTKANDGSVSRWLDGMLVKLAPAMAAMSSFASGIGKAITAIAAGVVHVKNFVGGWERFGMLIAGLGVITVLGPMIAALAALSALVLTVGQIVWATTAAFYAMATSAVAARMGSAALWVVMAAGRVAMIGMIAVSYGASLAMGAMGGAAGLMAGALAILTSPITLIVGGLAALAAGAYYLYNNWASVKASLSETGWGQMLLVAINMILSPVQTFNSAVAYLQGLWASTKASLSETTWGQSLLTGITTLFSPFAMFRESMQLAGNIWSAVKAKLGDTSWGQAIISTVNAVKNAISGIGNAIDSAKAAASAKASSMWASAKSMVGMGGPDGAKAIGGTVTAGGIYRVNELGPELLNMAGRSYLMASQNGTITPLGNMNNAFQPAANAPQFTAPLVGQTQTGSVDANITIRVEADSGLRVASSGTETSKQGSLIRNVGVSLASGWR